jgi:hypothetical protein
MYSISLSIIVVAIGGLAAYFIDSKRQNHDMDLLGWFIFPLVYGAFSVKYGASWGFASIIQLLAGVGLYNLFFNMVFKEGTNSILKTYKNDNERHYQRSSANPSIDEVDNERDRIAEKLIQEKREWVKLLKKNSSKK